MGNNLKDIRKKISSVKNTQKTTRAMKLVSTSKLKKAEEVAKKSALYAKKLESVFFKILQKASVIGIENIKSPYFEVSQSSLEAKKVDVVFVTADKGLCGGFNQATIREVMSLMKEYKEKNIKVRLRGIGKKGISFFTFNGVEILDEAIDLSSYPDYKRSSDFIGKAVDDFLNGLTDEVIIVYNGFKTLISQEIKVKKILPFKVDKTSIDEVSGYFSVEPSDSSDEILDELARRYVEYSMYYALIDSLVAEHSSRVQAMDSATNNAGELVRSLTISYNKARQEAITTELVEINAGVEAIK